MSIRSIFFFLLLAFFSGSATSQVVFQDISKTSIYEFLDELANLRLIELNTFSKPYSRELIAQKLNSVDQSELNSRQIRELDFYLKDYNKELFPNKDFDKRLDLLYYKDSIFSFTLNPIIGAEYSTNENGDYLRRTIGGELFGYLGKNVGFYASLRDNVANDIIQNEEFLNPDRGANYKGSGDFSDMRGGITYSWNWGSLGLIKDNFTWGNNNFGANILSDKAPSYTRLQLKVQPVKWLDFEYFHGSLSSEVRDSARSYTAGVRQRNVDVRKFMAANIFTIRPFKYLNISIGNSIVYSDNLQAAFFIPFMFFKSIDHGVYNGSGNFGGGNSQIFFDISSRNLKGYHFYTSFFIDEISFSRMWDKDQHSNFVSMKFGSQRSNLFDKNISLAVEYTRTNPITYRHFVNTTTYESNNYNMGHYLRDNAQELAFKINVKPISRLSISANYIIAQKGEEYFYSGTTGNSPAVWGLDFIENERWNSDAFQLVGGYEFFNDVFFSLSYQYQKVAGVDATIYTSPFYQGSTNTFSAKINIGF
jgi:hypothetical protein